MNDYALSLGIDVTAQEKKRKKKKKKTKAKTKKEKEKEKEKSLHYQAVDASDPDDDEDAEAVCADSDPPLGPENDGVMVPEALQWLTDPAHCERFPRVVYEWLFCAGTEDTLQMLATLTDLTQRLNSGQGLGLQEEMARAWIGCGLYQAVRDCNIHSIPVGVPPPIFQAFGEPALRSNSLAFDTMQACVHSAQSACRHAVAWVFDTLDYNELMCTGVPDEVIRNSDILQYEQCVTGLRRSQLILMWAIDNVLVYWVDCNRAVVNRKAPDDVHTYAFLVRHPTHLVDYAQELLELITLVRDMVPSWADLSRANTPLPQGAVLLQAAASFFEWHKRTGLLRTRAKLGENDTMLLPGVKHLLLQVNALGWHSMSLYYERVAQRTRTAFYCLKQCPAMPTKKSRLAQLHKVIEEIDDTPCDAKNSITMLINTHKGPQALQPPSLTSKHIPPAIKLE